MTNLPRSLSFRMPAEATPQGYRPRPKSVLLGVSRLTRHFAAADKPAVYRVSFDLGEGEMLALLGPSAAARPRPCA